MGIKTHCPIRKTMMRYMSKRGVDYEMYKNDKKPFPVYRQAEFRKALGLPVEEPLPIEETYIELAEAYWVWLKVMIGKKKAKQVKKAENRARYKAFSRALDEALQA